MQSNTVTEDKLRGHALLMLLTIMLPACGQAEQDEAAAPAPAATESVQLTQTKPGVEPHAGSPSGGKPNILFIVSDDTPVGVVVAKGEVSVEADAVIIGLVGGQVTKGMDAIAFVRGEAPQTAVAVPMGMGVKTLVASPSSRTWRARPGAARSGR